MNVIKTPKERNQPKTSNFIELVSQGLEAIFSDVDILILALHLILQVSLPQMGHVIPKCYTVVSVGNLNKGNCKTVAPCS